MFEKFKDFVEFLKNIAIIIAFIGLALEFLVPHTFRQLKEKLDFDRSWYFVGTWDKASNEFDARVRFTSGASSSPLTLGPGERFRTGVILFPKKEYTRNLISDNEREANLQIIGRSNPTTKDSEITYLPTESDCLCVHDTLGITAKTSHKVLVWVKASVTDC